MQSKSGYSALHLVIQSGVEDERRILVAVDFLLEEGADCNVKTALAITPLHLACAAGLTTVVGKLVEQGADVQALDNSGLSAADYAKNNGHNDLIPLIMKRTKNI